MRGSLLSAFEMETPYLNIQSHSESPPKPRLTEILTLVVAILSLVLAHIQTQRARFWALLGVGLVTALASVYRLVLESLRALRISCRNRRATRRNSKELVRFSREAGLFFDPSLSRTDTLQGILRDLSTRHTDLVILSRIPNPGIFHEHWYYLDARIRQNTCRALIFHSAADELLNLLRSYNNFSVLPIFYTFAAEFRGTLTDSEKSKVNAFQQQYVDLLNKYIAFLQRLNDEFYDLPEFQTGIQRPAPL